MKLRLTSDGTWFDDDLGHEVGNHVVLGEIERLRSELAFEMEWVATAEHALCAFNTVMQRLLNLIEEFRAHQARGDFEGRAAAGGGA